jgi:hypothetical protein
VLNFALPQVLRNPLFVTAGSVNGKPARGADYLRRNPGGERLRIDIFEFDCSQGFAILTWVKVFHKSTNRRSKATIEKSSEAK